MMGKRQHYDIPFDLGDKVIIDGDASIKGIVTGLAWRTLRPEVEVSWVHNGEVRFAWITPERLAEAI